MPTHSGTISGFPYSFSRWTDVVAGKWSWFEACLDAGRMVAFNPRTAAPGVWSLDPQDTLGLVFWTKNPENLITHKNRLDLYNVVVHMTATGWVEKEKGAPDLFESGNLLVKVSEVFEKIYWRFSPVPLLPQKELLTRFRVLLKYAVIARKDRVFVSFLQENDRLPETRPLQERFDILNLLAEEAVEFGVRVILCADDESFNGWTGAFQTDVCAPISDFRKDLHSEECGCVSMVDPFTINEACHYDCEYCYTGDKKLSSNRRNTTLVV